jgi:hypothetical protein
MPANSKSSKFQTSIHSSGSKVNKWLILSTIAVDNPGEKFVRKLSNIRPPLF